MIPNHQISVTPRSPNGSICIFSSCSHLCAIFFPLLVTHLYLSQTQRKIAITSYGLHRLVWLWRVLHGREHRDMRFKLGHNVGQRCTFTSAGVQSFIVAHHSNQTRVSFSLLHCHLDHGTGTLPGQHHHGNAIWDCTALPVGQRGSGWESTQRGGRGREIESLWLSVHHSQKESCDIHFQPLVLWTLK